MERPPQINDSGAPTADSGNGLAAILLIAGMSFPLQLEQVSSRMPISAIRYWREAYCCHKNRFPAANAGKLSDKNVWAFRCKFFAADALCIGIGHIFFLKPLKPVFCYEQVPFKLEIEI
jgi:hypothetical protein